MDCSEQLFIRGHSGRGKALKARVSAALPTRSFDLMRLKGQDDDIRQEADCLRRLLAPLIYALTTAEFSLQVSSASPRPAAPA
jgi:hypothetical protein